MKGVLKFLLTAVAPFVVLLGANALRADEKEDARTAFNLGVKLFEDGRYSDAAFSFRKANELNPSWKIQYNIGQCDAALKRYGLALEAFEAYLVNGGDDVPTSRQREVRKEIARLRDLSGDLEVIGPEGAVVLIDGMERGKTPLIGPLREAVGVHVVSVFKDGEVLLEQEVKVSGVGLTSLKVDEPEKKPALVSQKKPLEEPAKAATPVLEKKPEKEPLKLEPEKAVASGDKRGSSLAVWGWVTAGTGVAVAIAGAVTGGVALKKAGTLKDACPDDVCQDPDDYKLKDKAEGLANATNVLLPVGGTLAVAGVVMIILGKRGEQQDPAAVSVAPVVRAGQGGLIIGGRF
jgi:hypothetical protein